jgi:hypothetical protein
MEGTDMPRGQYVRQPRDGATEPQSADQVMEAALSPRAAETRRERRRRDDGDIDHMSSMKLAVPLAVQEKLRAEGKVWRWVLDSSGRQTAMQANDWDIVEGVLPVAAGQADEQKLVLMAKYQDWHQKDEIDPEQAQIADMENRIVRADPETISRPGEGGLVVPKGQVNQISRQRGL